MTTAPKPLTTWLFSHRLLLAAFLTFSVDLLAEVALVASVAAGPDKGNQAWVGIASSIAFALLASASEGLLCLLLLLAKKTRRIAAGIAIGALANVPAVILFWSLMFSGAHP